MNNYTSPGAELAIYSCDPSTLPAWTEEQIKELDRSISRLREILKE
jgi:hypothetical protein